MTILSGSNLEKPDYGTPGWTAIYNKDIELLNDILLKIQSLLDVNPENLVDGTLLVWDSTASKWKSRNF